jgi:hypothetical protein
VEEQENTMYKRGGGAASQMEDGEVEQREDTVANEGDEE